MPYLIDVDDIRDAIAHYSRARTLWLDVEVADFNSPNPRSSILQVLDDSTDLTGDRVTILDLLGQKELINEFIEKIMINPEIEKVFHNAKYDSKFLGKRRAKNITCTWEMVRNIPYYLVPLPNYQLKTLAETLCYFPTVDKTEQGSDWGQRPLTEKQLIYARMDPVYTAHIHHRLLQLSQLIEPDPTQENLCQLIDRYQEIEPQWKILDTEIEHLKTRIKKVMKTQNISDFNGAKLAEISRRNVTVSLNNLAEIVYKSGQNFPVSIKFTAEMKKALDPIVEQLSIEEKIESYLQLKIKGLDQDD